MIASFGHCAIIFTVLMSGLLTTGLLSKKIDKYYSRLPMLIFILISISFSALIYSYAVSDFSVLNVALNSHTMKPMLYKITGAWGNHEGSMLLFLWLLSLYTFLFSVRNKVAAITKPVLRLQGFLLFCFSLYILFTSNPLIQLNITPENGQGLNPLLQDVGLAIHPPMLYIGYCGFSLAMSLAVYALWVGGFSRAWTAAIRPWILYAWSFLTLGIGLGSWWAYRELGWGGFWFWDPVENSSLLPWLAATALIHTLMVVEKRNIFKGWMVLLSILTFSLSIFGFFLVRSGLLTSVHSFASDPTRGLFLFAIIFIVVGGSLALYAARAHKLATEVSFAPFSRETTLVINNILLVTLCAVVLIGTVYPLILEVMTGDRISVGAPYFNQVFNPIAVALLLVAAVSPVIKWDKDNISSLSGFCRHPLFAALIGIALGFYLLDGILSVIGLAFSFWMIVATVQIYFNRYRTKKPMTASFYGMVFAHLGIGLLALSIVVIANLSQEKEAAMKPDDIMGVGEYKVIFNGEKMATGKNYVARQGEFVVGKGKKYDPITLRPEIRLYPIEKSQTTEAAIFRDFFFNDLYIVLGDSIDTEHTAVRVHYRPMINAIWFSVLLIALGGFVTANKKSKSRRR